MVIAGKDPTPKQCLLHPSMLRLVHDDEMFSYRECLENQGYAVGHNENVMPA